MSANEQIWDLAQFRFLQTTTRLWVINNKVLEIAFLVGMTIWVSFEFFSTGYYAYIKYFGLVLTVLTLIIMRSRTSCYEGYFDGYEHGFKDAATQNCDYWGNTHNEISDSVAIETVLNKIKENEEKISEENLLSREHQVKEGLSSATGFILTWRKIRIITDKQARFSQKRL